MSIENERPRVLITAGGTSEKIDEVRILTNISTGAFGTLFAKKYLENEWDVDFVCGKNVDVEPVEHYHGSSIFRVSDVENLEVTVKQLLSDNTYDVVIHSMAVSDYSFRESDSPKLPSGDPYTFVEDLRKRIYASPNILEFIISAVNRDETHIVGFKFSGATSHIDATFDGLKILNKGCDMVVLNTVQDVKTDKKKVALLSDLGDQVDISLFPIDPDSMSAREETVNMVFENTNLCVKEYKRRNSIA